MEYSASVGNPGLDLNLSPPRQMSLSPPHGSISLSPQSSCVSREGSPDEEMSESGGGMMVVGCPRCLVYVVLLREDPKCPKCKSTVLLDFLKEEHSNATTTSTTAHKK